MTFTSISIQRHIRGRAQFPSYELKLEPAGQLDWHIHNWDEDHNGSTSLPSDAMERINELLKNFDWNILEERYWLDETESVQTTISISFQDQNLQVVHDDQWGFRFAFYQTLESFEHFARYWPEDKVASYYKWVHFQYQLEKAMGVESLLMAAVPEQVEREKNRLLKFHGGTFPTDLGG